MILERKGDLFLVSASSSLAHCISKDCKLGAGIARKFRQKFGRIDKLKSMDTRVGKAAPIQINNRFIYNLITKEHYWDRPTYDSLRQSLISMRVHALKHNVIEICMPKIGCGLDRLEWKKVRTILDDVFGTGSINITVYTK